MKKLQELNTYKFLAVNEKFYENQGVITNFVKRKILCYRASAI